MEHIINKLAIAGVVMLASLNGCHHGDETPIVHGEEFAPDSQSTAIGNFAAAQTAAGAKCDAMLYDLNFHGSSLNSLGEVKLDLIRKGTPVGDPVIVYLNMPHDQVALREEAVSAYLKTAGIADTQITMIEGMNPNPSTPTAYNLTGLYKSDGTTYNGQANVDATAGAAGGGLGSK